MINNIYKSYKEALRNCSNTLYDSKKVADLVYFKTKNYRSKLYLNHFKPDSSELFLISSIGLISNNIDKKSINIIDYGGACGAHYFLIKRYFPELNFNWMIIETNSIVKICTQSNSKEISFYDSLDSAVITNFKTDIVLCSGTLQCIPDPFETLNSFIRLDPSYIILPRLALTHEKNNFLIIHEHMLSANGPGCAPNNFIDELWSYPFQFLSEEKLFKILSKNFNIEIEFGDKSGCINVDKKKVFGISLLFKSSNLNTNQFTEVFAH